MREERVPYVNPDSSANGIDDDTFCEEGDIVLADASEDINDVGKAIEVVSLDGEQVVAGTHTILGTRRGRVPVIGFSGQLFQSAAVRAGIKKEAQGAKVYGISAKRISAVPIPLPPTEAEQRKIADCLGSLDDLIAAEGRKLDALREHKQGLMQQLFPQPGETVPQLRCPEFWSYPHPEARELGDVCAVVNGGTPKSAVVEYWGGDVQWLTPKDMGQMDGREISLTERKISQSGLDGSSAELVPERSVIVSIRAPIGHLAINTTPMAFNQGCRGLVPGNEIGSLFLYYFLSANRDQLQRLGAGGTFKELSVSSLKSLTVPLPTLEEQQRIADCLGSLDDLIAAEGRKLEVLRQHKQGLVQQLFPALEGH